MTASKCSQPQCGKEYEGQNGGDGEAGLLGGEEPEEVEGGGNTDRPDCQEAYARTAEEEKCDDCQADDANQLPTEIAIEVVGAEGEEDWAVNEGGEALDTESDTADGMVIVAHFDASGICREPLGEVWVEGVSCCQVRPQVEGYEDARCGGQAHRKGGGRCESVFSVGGHLTGVPEAWHEQHDKPGQFQSGCTTGEDSEEDWVGRGWRFLRARLARDSQQEGRDVQQEDRFDIAVFGDEEDRVVQGECHEEHGGGGGRQLSAEELEDAGEGKAPTGPVQETRGDDVFDGCHKPEEGFGQ